MLSAPMYGYPWANRMKYGERGIKDLSPYKVTKEVNGQMDKKERIIPALSAVFHDLNTGIGKEMGEAFWSERYGSYR